MLLPQSGIKKKEKEWVTLLLAKYICMSRKDSKVVLWMLRPYKTNSYLYEQWNFVFLCKDELCACHKYNINHCVHFPVIQEVSLANSRRNYKWLSGSRVVTWEWARGHMASRRSLCISGRMWTIAAGQLQSDSFSPKNDPEYVLRPTADNT